MGVTEFIEEMILEINISVNIGRNKDKVNVMDANNIECNSVIEKYFKSVNLFVFVMSIKKSVFIKLRYYEI